MVLIYTLLETITIKMSYKTDKDRLTLYLSHFMVSPILFSVVSTSLIGLCSLTDRVMVAQVTWIRELVTQILQVYAYRSFAWRNYAT